MNRRHKIRHAVSRSWRQNFFSSRIFLNDRKYSMAFHRPHFMCHAWEFHLWYDIIGSGFNPRSYLFVTREETLKRVADRMRNDSDMTDIRIEIVSRNVVTLGVGGLTIEGP